MKKVGIVLLAAGNSIRYQGIKLLDIVDGEKMYLHILESAAKTNAKPKIIVTQYDEIQNKALEYGFEPVINHKPELGISHSIGLGLQKALETEPDLDGILFSVCDQPYLKQNTLDRLIDSFKASEKDMASICYGDIIGNPCIIGKKYYKDLFALEGDAGGKKIIRRFPENVELVVAENVKELTDIDVKEDLNER